MVKEKYQSLFEALQFQNGVELKNRIVMAPLTNYSSNEDGTVSDDEVNYYIRRSKGVGMVITACTYVTDSGKGFPGEFSATSDNMIPSLRRLATAIKEQGAKAVLQIFHAGRKSPASLVPNGDVVSASDYLENGEQVARALTEEEIQNIIRGYGETTRRAIEAGFDGVEIHGANYYLIHQFFSGHTNKRQDKWGGTVQQRMTFPLAVVDEVKRIVTTHATNDFIVGYRFSPEEEFEDGFTMDDTFHLVDALADRELDYLHVSLQDFWSKPRRGGDSTRTRMEQIQERVNDKTILIGVGSILTADDALKAKQSGIPLLALGRSIIIEPDWVQKIEGGKEETILVTVRRDAQQELEIPTPLWNRIWNVAGWFPVEVEENV
ncbi:NADH-dependent flavin oxidoreductase [Priestia taiwanensis]|uniref:NADH-dependent flavin oxidoreductase YqiG n=1 Tax=Priestia taiwanensis TaxID=1347902 RepID=A0A917ANH3_9BACI|nr:NADH-dependent flavin oxidoreductase [Priestia taiwanensis]MBM7362604.1 2,4-dienoyl-CoA reductase-like NADH-dependent reductase (Old Yellow Enzyme family) [Priestia taiwanensis]GGE63600.1 putative NADH-dependent flavin oxidoreductase YqiG [Priestia taiwanensis]